MKRHIFLYLFIFSLLINVFTYVYFTNQNKYEMGKVDETEQKETKLKDSIAVLSDKLEKADYFAVENDVNARDYYRGQDIEKLKIKIRDGIYAQNGRSEGNPLVQYPPLEGRPFNINEIKVLNSQWVLADFSNGILWGQVLIKYFIEDDGKVTYETAQTMMYPRRTE